MIGLLGARHPFKRRESMPSGNLILLQITWSSPLDARVGNTFLPDDIHLIDGFGRMQGGGNLLEGYDTKSRAYWLPEWWGEGGRSINVRSIWKWNMEICLQFSSSSKVYITAKNNLCLETLILYSLPSLALLLPNHYLLPFLQNTWHCASSDWSRV